MIIEFSILRKLQSPEAAPDRRGYAGQQATTATGAGSAASFRVRRPADQLITTGTLSGKQPVIARGHQHCHALRQLRWQSVPAIHPVVLQQYLPIGELFQRCEGICRRDDCRRIPRACGTGHALRMVTGRKSNARCSRSVAQTIVVPLFARRYSVDSQAWSDAHRPVRLCWRSRVFAGLPLRRSGMFVSSARPSSFHRLPVHPDAVFWRSAAQWISLFFVKGFSSLRSSIHGVPSSLSTLPTFSQDSGCNSPTAAGLLTAADTIGRFCPCMP